jgi:hypothetical protein
MLNNPTELSSEEAIEEDLTEITEDVANVNAEGEELEEAEAKGEEEVFLIGDKEITPKRLEELEKGFMLQSDYTKKRQLESRQYKDRMSELDAVVEQAKLFETFLKDDEKAVNWDSLLKSEEREIEGKFKARREEIAKVAEKAKTAKLQIVNAVLAETNKALFNHYPEWQGTTGEKQHKADIELAQKYAKSIGHTDETLSRLVDPAEFIAIIDAAKYHAIKNAKPDAKKERQAPKSVTAKKAVKTADKSWAEVFYGKG